MIIRMKNSFEFGSILFLNQWIPIIYLDAFAFEIRRKRIGTGRKMILVAMLKLLEQHHFDLKSVSILF